MRLKILFCLTAANEVNITWTFLDLDNVISCVRA